MDENPYSAPPAKRNRPPFVPLPPIKTKSMWPVVLFLIAVALVTIAILLPAMNAAS
jgi:hypothetical protein